MAKLTAPLLSFGAKGQIGKTQVMAKWRGISYARQYVVPANPKTQSQQNTRGVFTWLSGVWKLMDHSAQAVWTLYAKGKPLTDRNAFTKFNLANLRGTDLDPVTDIDAFIGSPGVNGGLASPALVLADATGHVATATLTAPSLPAGWTITKEHALAIKEANANTSLVYTSVYAMDDTSPYAASLSTGAAGTYIVTAWFEYVKPDGSVAHGPSITHTIVLA